MEKLISRRTVASLFFACGTSCVVVGGVLRLLKRRAQRKTCSRVNTLALLAAAEADKEIQHSSLQSVAQWQAILDCLETSTSSIGLWVELGLVEPGVEGQLSEFVGSLSQVQLPAFQGSQEIQRDTSRAVFDARKLVKAAQQLLTLRTMRGSLVTSTSRHHTLILAIGVGIDVATQCSRHITARSEPLFLKHPSLRRRACAALAERSYFLPQEGSWMSPPHAMAGFHFVELAPELFQQIRSSMGIDDKTFTESVCTLDFSAIEFVTNSRSGGFFFLTHDGKFIVKTIPASEAEALIHLLSSGYLEHCRSADGSLLARILGLYQVVLPWFNQFVIVQENLLHRCGSFVSTQFDLKGSTHQRTAKPGESVLKDNDWLRIGHRLGLADEVRQTVATRHRRDCEFLAACGVIDYSMLVVSVKRSPVSRSGSKDNISSANTPHDEAGRRKSWRLVRMETFDNRRAAFYGGKDHGPFESASGLSYHIGVIDYLTLWSWRKRLEFVLKVCLGLGKVASVNPPPQYAERQINFVDRSM